MRYYLSGIIRKIAVIILISVFGILNHLLFAQMQDISEKDNESLKEAEKIKSEAEQLQITANDLYLEAAMLEQNENFATDKKIQKEYKKNQQDAQKTELKAAEKFQESNKIQIDIYQKYIGEFWKDFEGDESVLTNARLIEETSKEYFVRASTARDEAKRIENQIEKFLKLSEAYEYELIGIEKLQSAYTIYKNWPDITGNETDDNQIDFQISDSQFEEKPIGTNTLNNSNASNDYQLNDQIEKTEKSESSEPTQLENQSSFSDISQQKTFDQTEESQAEFQDNVEVNPVQVEKILRYMEKDNDTIYYLANEVDGFDMSSIQKFWDSYRNVEYKEETKKPLLANERSMEEEPTSNVTTEMILENLSSTESDKSPNQSSDNKVESNQSEVEIGRVTETVVPDPNSKIIYRIQIAADKSPLSQSMLQKLFYAKHKIAMVDEGGWYKYSIGEFNTFEDANEFRKTLNRDDAFVVAYRDAMDVQYVETTEKATTGIVMAKKRPEIQGGNITFVVQIAASKKSMDENSLKRIYKGELPIKSRFEDNWYKYQIGHTNSYLEIKEIKNNVDVYGAFIVAYDGDKKLKLWQAINTVHSSNGQTIFVLQIAASKTKLSDDKINSIFSGNDHVIEIYEEGWYKYHIVCGNTYYAARRFKNLWGIKNSFIVAYKNNNKIDIRQAIKETSN